ncbi:MAG TPA: hypothetical protein EYG65_05730 [Rhodospirillales bacterium]|nr:hypothetical protein [Rhodospirillales bacterium]
MHKTLRIAISLALIIAIGLSCRKDGTGPSWDVEILAPLLRAELSLQNIIADSLLSTAPDSALSIVYKGTAYRFSLDTLVNIPDETVQQTFISPLVSAYLQPGDPIPFFGSQQETKYDLKGVELKQVKIRSGWLTFELSSSIQEIVDLNYLMPDATKAGVPFSITESIPAGTQTIQATITRSYDLSGYTIDMRGVNLNNYNTMVAQFTANISPSATDSVVINQGDKFDMKYTFTDIETEFAIGYFGSYSISNSYTEPIDIFKNIPSGYLNIDSIRMNMKIENGFGIDAQLRIDTLKSINTTAGGSAALTHSLIGNAINLTRALNFASPGYPFTYSEYNITVNTNNSNINALVETLPDQFQYALVMDINPFGNNSYGNDFLYYASDVKISVDLNVPARFEANGLTIADTVDFDLGKDPGTEHETTIIEGFFYLYADNGFPFDARLQIYLYDESFAIIDSLMVPPNNIITAAPVDLSNKVITKFQSRLDIPVDDEKMILFEQAKKALVKIVFSTKPNNQIMTIYSDYQINLKLVGDITYRAKVN